MAIRPYCRLINKESLRAPRHRFDLPSFLQSPCEKRFNRSFQGIHPDALPEGAAACLEKCLEIRKRGVGGEGVGHRASVYQVLGPSMCFPQSSAKSFGEISSSTVYASSEIVMQNFGCAEGVSDASTNSHVPTVRSPLKCGPTVIRICSWSPGVPPSSCRIHCCMLLHHAGSIGGRVRR